MVFLDGPSGGRIGDRPDDGEDHNKLERVGPKPHEEGLPLFPQTVLGAPPLAHDPLAAALLDDGEEFVAALDGVRNADGLTFGLDKVTQPSPDSPNLLDVLNFIPTYFTSFIELLQDEVVGSDQNFGF